MVNLVAADSAELEVVTDFPRSVREVSHFWIPLRDGTRLAARMWLPDDAYHHPVSAIIEYIPYRQADFTAPRDRLIHPYFAGYGYAAIRVDIRGSGNSEGVPMDEYVKQEQDDALEVLEWISSQDWCNGNTGMIGISWGGFAALQIAARRPPSLKAIITVCSTDDRYADDVHYMGGCLLSNNLAWGGVMHGYAMRPPDPEIVGEAWRDMWMSRMRSVPPVLATWMEHPTRDEYWRHGSVCESYEDIRCAVYAVGGWTDGYTNAIPRLYQHLKCPTRAVIGPWAHGYPHIAAPGPAIGFLQDAVRWWDRHLQGIANGIDEEPGLMFWMQEARAPASSAREIPGRWVGQRTWPDTGHTQRFFLGPGELLDEARENPASLALNSALSTGTYAGEWCPHGIGPELSLDQRYDAATSLVFDSKPLSTPMEIFGAPILSVTLSSDEPNALLVARLCVVAADGAATRISYGLLNLTHREDHAQPKALESGERYTVTLTLNHLAQSFPTGHRLRLLLSTGHWPMVWPSPRRATLTIDPGDTYLEIPTPALEHCEDTPQFERPCVPLSAPLTWLRPVRRERHVNFDWESTKTTVTWLKDDGAYRLDETGLEVDAQGEEQHSIVDNDPLSAQSSTRWTFEHRRNDWRVRVCVRATVRATAHHFLVGTSVHAYEGDKLAFGDTQEQALPRRFL